MRLLMLISTLAAAVAAAGAAWAEVRTPAGCHWVPTSDQPDTVALWCRGEDGRARPTGQTLAQGPAARGDGCPGGLLYDGIACVSEQRAMAAVRWPTRAATLAPPPASAPPRVMVFADRKGRMTRGLACFDEPDVTVCKPIPRR